MSDEPDADIGTAGGEPPSNEPSDHPNATESVDAEHVDPATERSADDGTEDLVRYARYALLAGLTLLALLATVRFYFAVSTTIDRWVAREYRSLFQAAFNLVVLLVAAIGISWEVRKVAG